MKNNYFKASALILSLLLSFLATAEVPSALKGCEDMNYGPGKNGYILLPSIRNSDDIVDKYLAEDTPYSQLLLTKDHKENGMKGDVLYRRTVMAANPAQRYGWQGYIFRKEVIEGKTVEYQLFENPSVLYIIADFPDNGRFYGFYTYGFDAGHPFNDRRIISGYVIDKDGNRKEVAGLLPSEQDNSNFKPARTYYAKDLWGMRDAQLNFNPNGTGTITLKKTSRHQAVPYMSESGVQRYANGKVKKKHRGITGGYHFYAHATVTFPVKWNVDQNNILKMTISAKPTVRVEGEVDAESEFANTVITESDKRIEKAAHRADLPTNEDFLEVKNGIIEEAKEKFTQGLEIVFPVLSYNNEMMVAKFHNKKNEALYAAFTTAKQNSANEWYYALFTQVPQFTQDYLQNRESGIQNYYPILIQRFKNAIKGTDIDILAKANEFVIDNINIDEMTGKINFFSEGKLYAATLKINEDDSIDKTAFNQSLTSENPYTRKLKQIKEDNDRIMSYTKDKRRAKVVKKYEKECKKYRDVLESPMTGFSNLEQLISYAVKTAEIQKSYLELLE